MSASSNFSSFHCVGQVKDVMRWRTWYFLEPRWNAMPFRRDRRIVCPYRGGGWWLWEAGVMQRSMVDNLPTKKSVSWYHKSFVLLSGEGKSGTAEGRELRVTSALPLPSVSPLSKCQTKWLQGPPNVSLARSSTCLGPVMPLVIHRLLVRPENNLIWNATILGTVY